MKAFEKAALIAALVGCLAVSDAWARGGGRGGPGPGHAGGPGGVSRGHGPGPGPGPAHGSWAPGMGPWQNPAMRPGNLPPASQIFQQNQAAWRNAGSHQAQWAQWQIQGNLIRTNVQNRYNHLFTPQWYRDHPQAWRATHPHADAWAVATAAAMASWIGWAVPAPYGYGQTTIYEGGTTYVNTDDPDATQPSVTTPAPQGQSNDGQNNWLPIGVYALAGEGHATTDRVLQLALARDGTVGGTYFDAMTNQDLPVQGSVDRQTGRVWWTVGKNQRTVMESDLTNLAKDQSPVAVRFGDAAAQNWLLVRLNTQSPPANPR